MKKIILYTAIVCLSLTSCKKEFVTSTEDQTLRQNQMQTVAGNASNIEGAVPFKETFIVNWDGQRFYNPCTNEIATVYGSEKVLVHGVYNGAKSIVTVNVHFLQGFRAVGESGRQYVIEESFLYQENNFSNGVLTTKLVANMRWLTKGGGNNWINNLTSYIKVDAEGNVTFIREPVNETYCQ
jgi:hypothetical protein